jgi:type I restriction enzyme S subunit
VPLGDLTTLISSGSTPKGGSEVYVRQGPVMLIRSQNVRMNALVLDDVAYVTDEIDAQMVRSRVKCGDVLLNITGASIGRVATFDLEHVEANVNQHVCIIRPRPDALFGRYLSYFISSPEFQLHIDRLQHGGTRQALTFSQIAEFGIPLPPLPEQHRIAAILDKADQLRAKRRAALEQLNGLTQSVFLEMFGDPATNPKAWKRVPFEELGTNEDSKRVPVKSSDRDGRKGEYPYYGASGIIDWVDAFLFDGERLLVGEDGANLLARSTPIAFMASGKFWVNNHAHVIASNGRARLRFLEYFLATLDLKPFVSGTAQPKLTRSSLDRIQVPLPPIGLQSEFANRAAAIDRLTTASGGQLDDIDRLFASLQHQAFSGALCR